MTDKQAYLKSLPDISDDFLSVPPFFLTFKIHGSITYIGSEELDASGIWASFLNAIGVNYGGSCSPSLFETNIIQFYYSDDNFSPLCEWCRKLWNDGYLEYGKKDGGGG